MGREVATLALAKPGASGPAVRQSATSPQKVRKTSNLGRRHSRALNVNTHVKGLIRP